MSADVIRRTNDFKLKPVDMVRIRIIGLNSVLEGIISLMHERGVLQIERVNNEKLNILPGHSLDKFDDVSQRIVRLRNLFTRLDEMDILKKSELNKLSYVSKEENIQNIDTVLNKIDNDVGLKILESSLNDIDKIKSEISTIEHKLKEVLKLRSFRDIDFSRLETKLLKYIPFEVSEDKLNDVFKKLNKILSEISFLDSYGIKTMPRYKNESNVYNLLLLGFKWGTNQDDINNSLDKVKKYLSDNECIVLEVPKGITKPRIAIDKYNNQIIKLSSKLRILIEETKKHAIQNSIKLLVYYHILSIYSDRYSITSKFGFTKDTFVLEGWIKKSAIEFLKHGLHTKFNDNAVLEIVKTNEEPPVYLENPKVVSPFEFITKNYSLPNYEELDPSLVFFVTIPLLYGMIVGDVGYAILSFFLAGYLKKKYANEMVQQVGTLWQIAAIPTAVFGVIFDEWLGMSHVELIEFFHAWGVPFVIEKPLYTGLSRVHDLPILLLFTIIVGVLHLALGFILGAIENWNHHRKHAYGKLAWLLLEIGVVLAFLPMAGLSNTFTLVGLAIAIISIIIIGWSEGVYGLVELPGVFGNMLSYARIAAVGIAGLILAELIDKFLLPVPKAGLMLLITLPLFAVLHIANGLLAMFEALIQGGRLNIVEFRSKFLQGGGRLFKPFSEERIVPKV